MKRHQPDKENSIDCKGGGSGISYLSEKVKRTLQSCMLAGSGKRNISRSIKGRWGRGYFGRKTIQKQINKSADLGTREVQKMGAPPGQRDSKSNLLIQ